MNLSIEIKEARARLGLTQSQAAEKWGIPLPTLKAYEKLKRTPRGLAMTMLRQILSAAMSADKPASASSAAPVPPVAPAAPKRPRRMSPKAKKLFRPRSS